MPSSVDVLGIGNAIVDVLTRVDDDFIRGQDLVKGSMLLIDEDRATSLYGAMGPGIEISGGSAANTIAGVASFGASASYIGKVRDDQLGEVFGHDIRAAGVAFNTPPAKTGPATGRCLVLVTPDGERTMNTFLGASTGLGPDDIGETQVAGAHVIYLEGYLWDPDQAKQAFLKAARIARGAGRKVSLSLSDSFCVDRHRDSFLELIRAEVDILFANEAEIVSLYQTDTFEDALAAVRQDCALAALTRSGDGSVIVDGETVHTVPAVPVERFEDATGAGDLYAAGFLSGYVRGLPADHCARLGSLAASEVISHLGARPRVSLAELAEKSGL